MGSPLELSTAVIAAAVLWSVKSRRVFYIWFLGGSWLGVVAWSSIGAANPGEQG